MKRIKQKETYYILVGCIDREIRNCMLREVTFLPDGIFNIKLEFVNMKQKTVATILEKFNQEQTKWYIEKIGENFTLIPECKIMNRE